MDGKRIAADMFEWLVKFFNTFVPIKLPGDIELTVWMWLVIITFIVGILTGLFVWLRKRN